MLLVHVHVVHGSPEIVGGADIICSLRAGISTGIIVGATSLLAVWGSDDLSARGRVSPLALWTLAPLTRLAGGSLAGIMGPVNSTCWLHYLECEAIVNNLWGLMVPKVNSVHLQLGACGSAVWGWPLWPQGC